MRTLNLLFFLAMVLSTISKSPLHISLFTTEEEPALLKFSTPMAEVKIISLPDESLVITHDDKILLRYNNSRNITFSDYNFATEKDLKIESFENDIYYQDVSQWKLYAIEDFQNTKEGWSKESVSSCGTSTNIFLGGHCNFASEVASKTWLKIPIHSMVMIKFNFHFIDNWAGEVGYAKLDDEIIWQESHNWCEKVMPWFCKKYGINSCGNEYPDIMSRPGFYVGPHNKDTLTLSFSSTLKKQACEASWGLDDIQIYVK